MGDILPLSNPKFQLFDSNGNPLVGGKIYSYEAGGVTAKATYSEYTLTTENANPVVLDARGEANIFLGSGHTKLVAKTSADVTLWTLDNLSSNRGGYIKEDNADHSSSGTGEDDLATYTLAANTLGTTGGLKVFAAGTKTGTNGNKTLKFYFGATSVTFHNAANNADDWRFEATIFNTATNAQRISWVAYGTIVIMQGYDTAAIDTTASVSIKITGECAHASDVITQTMWLIEV